MISTKLHPWTPKLLWLIVPSLAGASLWWFAVARVLQGRMALNSAAVPLLAGFIVFGLLGIGLWLGSFNLMAYLLPRRLARLALALVAAWPMVIFFPPKPWTIIGALLLWLGLWLGIERVGGDAQSRLSVQPRRSLGAALPATVTVIILAVSLLYYQQLLGSTRTSDELSTRLSGQTVSLAERFLGNAFKEYRPDMTVDEVIGLQVPSAAELLKDLNFDTLNQAELQEKLSDALSSIEGFDPASFRLDPAANRSELERQLDAKLNETRRQLSTEVRQNLSDQFGVPISGNDLVHDVLVRIVNRQFERYVRNYVQFVPWLLVLALFFILRIFSSLFLWSASIIGWLVYRLYRSLHLIEVQHETVPAEVLNWHS